MEKQILAASSYYKKSYYYNFDSFADLPHAIQEELQKIMTAAAEQTAGEILSGFYSDGQVFIESRGADDDLYYDEIGAKYYVNRLATDEGAFFESLQLWFVITRTDNGRAAAEEFVQNQVTTD